MDFDSPDVAKEFPGLCNDPAEYEEDEKTKRKKDKKDSKKDKGYATLAGESSHEEDELLDPNPAKLKKIKTSFKLSTKKKEKKPVEKLEKERKHSDKDKAKVKDKEKKLSEKDSKEDDKKTTVVEKEKSCSSTEKDKTKEKKLEKEKDKKPEKEKDKKPEKEKDKKSEKEKEKKVDKKKKLSIGEKDLHTVSSLGNSLETTSPNAVCNLSTEKEKEKEKGLNLNMTINAFLNAPAPLLSKKDKEHKKEKESSAASKVKLKLKRSKNSLEDSSHSQSSQASDIPIMVSHQFPESSEAIVKEIRKYEALLEQTHSQMKSNKKVSKKSEEQLWELQRTLTQLKRKLRSINALSTISVSNSATVNSTPAVSQAAAIVNVPAALLPDSSIGTQNGATNGSSVVNTAKSSSSQGTTTIIASTNKENGQDKIKGATTTTTTTTTNSTINQTNEIKPTSEASRQTVVLKSSTIGLVADEDMRLDFTLKTLESFTLEKNSTNGHHSSVLNSVTDPKASKQSQNNSIDDFKMDVVDSALSNEDSSTSKFVQNESSQIAAAATTTLVVEVDSKIINQDSIESFSSPPLRPSSPFTLSEGDSQSLSNINSNHHNLSSQRRSSNLVINPVPLTLATITTPDAEIERLQVQVQVHNTHMQQSPSDEGVATDGLDYYKDTGDSQLKSVDSQNSLDATQLSSVIKTLTFSDDEYDDDDIGEVTDVSCLSMMRNNDPSDSIDLPRVQKDNNSGSTTEMDPFEMPIFENEEYLPIENEALIYFNEELQEEIAKEEKEIEHLMEQLIQMKKSGVDIDAPEIDLSLDQFDHDELISLWQITKLENEALNEHVNNLRRMVAVNKLEEFKLETRLRYLEESLLPSNKYGNGISNDPMNPEEHELYTQSRL